MAANTGKGHRIGSVTNRTQFENTATGGYTKRDATTGQFLANSDGPFKGVRSEKPKGGE